MEMTIAPRIANPRVSMVRPSDVNPSIAKTSDPISVERYATNRSRAPLITKEIRPKLIM